MMKISTDKIFTGIGLDFETGGLDCTTCACTQIALQSIRLDTMEMIDRYVSYITPYNQIVQKKKVLRNKHELETEQVIPMKIEQVALDYSGITMEMLLNQGVDMKEVAKDVIEFGKKNTLSKGAQCKPILIGQNITFDIGFLQQLINYAGLQKEFSKVFSGKDDFYGNFQPHYIDTIFLARLALAHNSSVTSYKLELIAEWLGIELDDAHDADADVTATLNVARVCANRMRNNEGGDGSGIQRGEKSRKYFKI